MKRILYIFSFVFLLIVSSFNVYASDSANDFSIMYDKSDVIRDDDGRHLNGYILWQYDYSEVFTYKERNYIYGDNVEYIYLVRSCSGSSTSYTLCGKGVVDCENWYIRLGNDEPIDSNNSVLSIDLGSNLVAATFNTDSISNLQFTTSLPIFDSDSESFDEDVKNYIESGDTTGAINDDDISAVDKFSSDVPKPKNLKVLSGINQNADKNVVKFTRDVVIQWQVDELLENMSYEIKAYVWQYRISDTELVLDEFQTSPQTIVNAQYYNTTQNVTLSNNTLNKLLSPKGFIRKLVIQIRSINDDNKTSSDWAVLTIDVDEDSATAGEENYDENGQATDDTYDANFDSETDGGGSLSFDFNNILGLITSGFGLIGNGSLIDLMASTFSFIPASVWDLIKASISATILIMIIGLLKKLVLH